MKTFLISYPYRGNRWSLEVPANSFEEAEDRLTNIAFGRVDGEIKIKITVVPHFVARLFARVFG